MREATFKKTDYTSVFYFCFFVFFSLKHVVGRTEISLEKRLYFVPSSPIWCSDYFYRVECVISRWI